MKSGKKTAALLLMLALLTSALTGCGDRESEAKEKPEPILRQKEKGDAISAQYRKEYADGKNVGPARPLGTKRKKAKK